MVAGERSVTLQCVTALAGKPGWNVKLPLAASRGS
jgi:hypothetical protein